MKQFVHNGQAVSVSTKWLAYIACVAFLLYSLVLFEKLGIARENTNTCAGFEVRQTVVSIEIERPSFFLSNPSPKKITIAPAKDSASTTEKWARVVAVGPVLGSMDSGEVKTDVACTTKGIVLTATITRSANYHGAVLQNVLWRPRIEIEVALPQPNVHVEATWMMRLTNGAVLNHAQTPPYPDITYPITVRP